MLYLVILDFISLMIPSVSLHSANAIFYNDSSNDPRHGSCRLRSVREAVDAPSGRSMTESFVLDDVEYKLCRYHVTWDEALVFCSTHKAHLATLDNNEKTSFVVQAMASSTSVSEDYWIGARKYYGDSWTWDSNAKGLSSEMDIIDNVKISYPGDETNDVHCLTIDRIGHNVPIFVPRACNQQRGFICQRDNEQTFDNKIRMVAASRIGEQEFRLYSGKATWADAVVQCRQEGLQIGEVNTVEEARALAASMLRNRPEGIESAWIGGYTRKNDPGTWRWLASGEKIKNNEMWQSNLTESLGGCLLLDRHLCDVPVYVETTCDRKRDVLCQKPPKKRWSKKPAEAIVEGCLYWIGFYPLKWSEARRSCDSVDASLVVLESPKIISHMMSLMLDNRAELRHIWTDGRRTGKYGRWQWEVNGEAVPTFGKSFIPWCPEENNNASGIDCLNLDRENLDSPLVYGLSCNERQSYVCQPRIGNCVSRSTAASGATETTITTKFQTLPSFYESIKPLKQSKVTGTLPMTADYYVSTSRNTGRYNMDSLSNWRPGESISSKNSTFGLSKYLQPLTRFTLPSFPRFGIKLASALETTTKNPSFSYDNKRNKNIKQLLATSLLKSAANSSSSTITTSTKKNSLDSRKASQVPLKKLNLSSVTSTYLGGYVESTSRTSKNSKIITNSDKFEGKNLTIIGKTVSPEPADSLIPLSENERTRKYSQKTTRDLTSNLTKILLTTTIPTTKDLNHSWNDEGIKRVTNINAENAKAEARLVVEKFSPNTLIRITTTTTTALPMRLKKLRPTTEFTTPYDAIDEDYYENYETRQSTESNEDSNSEFIDEYDESYDAPKNFESKKRIKQTSTSSIRKSSTTTRTTHLKIKKTKKIPIAQELSRNLKVALVDMLTKGIERNNRTVSTEENVKQTMKILPKEVLSENITLEKSLKMRNMTETWSLRPYYAFEGPMIVGLAESLDRSSDKSDESYKSHVFKFTGKKSNDVFANNEISDARRYFNNRGIDFREPQSDKTSNVPETISDLPPIRPNDPNSLMQMGRYFKNKFGNFVATTNTGRTSEKIGRAEELEGYMKGSERAAAVAATAGWPIGRYRGQQSGRARLGKKRGYPTGRDDEFRRNRYENQNLNLNYYESARRLYPRGDLPLFSRMPMRTDERSWLERLSVSWPNFTNTKTSNLGQVVSERNFQVPVRTTRSFNDDSETVKIQRPKISPFPNFKISKLIKEVKIDLDQRLLRNYLESLARRIARAEDNSRHRKDDWRDSWRYIVGQMSRILDGMSINVNGDVMKVRVGSEETREFKKIDDLRKIEWRKKLRKRKKDFDNFATILSRKKMTKINDTSGQRNSSKFMANGRVLLANNLEKQSLGEVDAKNHETTEGYGYSGDNSMAKDSQRSNELERNSLEQEIKPENILSPKSSQSPSRYNEKLMMASRKIFLDRYRATSGPLLGDKMNFPRFNDAKKLNNWYRTKYPSFNNSRVLAAPAIFRSVGIPRVYGFQPMMQQLHHRLAFNQNLRQFRGNERINRVPQKASILTGEYLPKGTLSRIVSSENQRFNDEISGKNNFFQIRTNSSMREENYSHDHSRNNLNATNFDILREMREDWPTNFENKLENRDFTYHVNNENETNLDKNEDEFEAAEIENEEPRLPENYQPKTIWSPSLRLGKAMELSNFRKFRQNPAGYLPTKNLVTRSLRNDVISRKYDTIRKNYARSDNDRGRYEIIKNLENLPQEPSTVSLRMIINPDDKDTTAGTRISRQSSDSLALLKNPRTIELRLGFSGNEMKSSERVYPGLVEDYRKELSNISTVVSYNGTTRLLGPYNRTKIKIASRFIEKIRRREMMEKLREKSRKFVDQQNWQDKFEWKGENASTIADSRDRQSRTAGIKGGNNSLEGKTLKNYSLSRPRYSASSASLRSFEDKNSTSKWRKFRDKDFNVDWSEQAASLLRDSRENNDQLTLYVDLALGRVGKKLKRAGKSRT